MAYDKHSYALVVCFVTVSKVVVRAVHSANKEVLF